MWTTTVRGNRLATLATTAAIALALVGCGEDAGTSEEPMDEEMTESMTEEPMDESMDEEDMDG